MEGLDSVFICQEREQELRQKLVDATHELETTRNVKTELFNLLNTAYQERDEARCQLQKLMNKLVPSNNPVHLQDMFVPGINHESHFIFPSTKPNQSITESSSLSHGSSPVDSFFDHNVSSPEFSNINIVDSSNNSNNKMGYLNQQNLVQDFNYLPSDHATAVIDCIARERELPQKGKLLQAVIDAGPLLQTILLAGPLPTWRNPPPLQDIKVPPLTIKEYDNDNNTTAFADDTGNSVSKTKIFSLLQSSSNVPSSCSSSMLNFAGHSPPGSWNNSWKFSSSSSVRIQVPPRKRQRHQ